MQVLDNVGLLVIGTVVAVIIGMLMALWINKRGKKKASKKAREYLDKEIKKLEGVSETPSVEVPKEEIIITKKDKVSKKSLKKLDDYKQPDNTLKSEGNHPGKDMSKSGEEVKSVKAEPSALASLP